MTDRRKPRNGNVLPFSFRKQRSKMSPIRLSPELDGLELLYTSNEDPHTLCTIKILAWARLRNGQTVAMVPWLKRLACATELADPINGCWKGYRMAGCSDIFRTPPRHKVKALDEELRFFGWPHAVLPDAAPIQEIPDPVGTHAVFSQTRFESLDFKPVSTWRLFAGGQVVATVIDEDLVTRTPVLPGDDCLRIVQRMEGFQYFFQHRTANLLKAKDPNSLLATSLLEELPEEDDPAD